MRVDTPMLLLRLHWLAFTDIAPRLCCMQGVYDGSVQALSLALVGSSELVGASLASVGRGLVWSEERRQGTGETGQGVGTPERGYLSAM